MAPRFKCGTCGSARVQVSVWVRPNEPDATPEAVFDDGQSEWCDDCDDHCDVVEVPDDSSKKGLDTSDEGR